MTGQNRTLISFDIDGTLVVGQPPGPITFAMVAESRSRGHLIGSASDRTVSEQLDIWKSAGIEVDFVCNKHRLAESVAEFACARMLHIGDTAADERYAKLAGFEFLHVNELTTDWTTFMALKEKAWSAAD